MKLAVALLALLSSANAFADGEESPMLGINLVGGETALAPDQTLDLAGIGGEVAWWHGAFGLAVEGSSRWSIATDGTRAFVAGGSARLRLFDRMVRSLIEPRDCELAFELHAIVEHTWWNDRAPMADPNAYGLGVAMRLRGGGDAPGSTLLAESRFFLRVTTSRWSGLDGVARTTMPSSPTDRAYSVVFGIGASWGSGSPAYVQKFKPEPFGSGLLL